MLAPRYLGHLQPCLAHGVGQIRMTIAVHHAAMPVELCGLEEQRRQAMGDIVICELLEASFQVQHPSAEKFQQAECYLRAFSRDRPKSQRRVGARARRSGECLAP